RVDDDVRTAQSTVVELAGLAEAKYRLGVPHPAEAVVGVGVADPVTAVVLVAGIPHLVARLAFTAIENGGDMAMHVVKLVGLDVAAGKEEWIARVLLPANAILGESDADRAEGVSRRCLPGVVKLVPFVVADDG